jgi:hypothetical protein
VSIPTIVHIAGMERMPIGALTYRVFVITIGPNADMPDYVVENVDYATASGIVDALNFLFDDKAPCALTLGRKIVEDDSSEIRTIALNVFEEVKKKDDRVKAQWKEA